MDIKKKLITLIAISLLFLQNYGESEASENRYNMEYVNIDNWHDNGFTGKGVKILINEGDAVYVDNPRYNGTVIALKDRVKSNFPVETHASKTVDLIKQIAPDATIYVTDQFMPSTMEAVRLVHPHIISRSYNTFENVIVQYESELQQLNDRGIFYSTSAGNSGDSNISPTAKYDFFWTVGAGFPNPPRRTGFSAYGEGLDGISSANWNVCIQPFECTDSSSSYYSGTSASTASFSAMVALFYQLHFDVYGKYPSVKTTEAFFKRNALDMGDKGYDIYHGYGFLKLPELSREGCLMKMESDYSNSVKLYHPILKSTRYTYPDYLHKSYKQGFVQSECK